MSPGPRWIRQFHKPVSPANPPLLIFPHVGAGASAYRTFSKAFSAHYDVHVVQYPGRQDRIHEPAPATLPEFAVGAFAEFTDSGHSRTVPITTFGHSMGSIISFEFARLAEAAGFRIRRAYVSAAVAPCVAHTKEPVPKEDEALLDFLTRLDGTSGDVMSNRDLMRMTLPVVKQDYLASEKYSCEDDARINAPIHAIGGDNDPIVSLAELNGWRKHSDEVEITVFEGGHFYLHNYVEELTELLTPRA
ncbi:thioesterase II family protein [Nocardia carnea]|uniref:thioesterase II family protein n=1 Tax=Nocardia carnea TaxID=37328 RepID=UPI00245435AF|nr:alpha/beta fold hydrolase [Nocardia carnea]